MLRLKSNQGFTLLEMILVTAIIAALVSFAVPIYGSTLDKSKSVVCSANADTLDRQITAALLLEPTATSVEKEAVARQVVLSLGATPNGYGYDDLCPSGGTYMISFTGRHGAVIFCTEHGGPQWERGQTYQIGDTMTSHGFVFQCLRAHTTGTTSRTRDPSLRSNKSSWEVIGYTDAPLEYSSTVRYAVDMEVVYQGKIYSRKDFNLVGGQVPYDGKDSDYWRYVSDVETD